MNSKLEKTTEKLEKKKATLLDSIAKGAEDSAELREKVNAINKGTVFTQGSGTTVKDALAKYDSLQQADGFVMRAIMHRSLKVQYGGQEAQRTIGETMQHNLPKLMFILLPFFALLLKMAYFRRKMYYTEHAIFTIHIHTLIFVLSLIALLIYQLWHYDGLYGWMTLIVYIYFIIALKRFYGGSIGKALLKSILILACYGTGAIIILLAYVITIAAIAL
jgi:5-carboxymethyl-2-hydroxymuconate isomerase